MRDVKKVLWLLGAGFAAQGCPASKDPVFKPPIGQVDDVRRFAAAKVLEATVDQVLRELPAAREEADALNGQMAAQEAKLGPDEVSRRLANLDGQPVERSAATMKAQNAVMTFNEKWAELRFDELVAMAADAGQLNELARGLRRRGVMLKKAAGLLEEMDRARAAVKLLAAGDGGGGGR